MKIGDRVKVNPYHSFNTEAYKDMRGKMGTVTWCHKDSEFFDVDIDGKGSLLFTREELVPISYETSNVL